MAAMLPEDRSDVMYHGYDGGGLKVDGPSVLVRKAYKDKVSVWGNYYVDMITSASIDVVTTASEYNEKRNEKSVGVDYLHGKTFMGLSYTNSEESDYTANTVRFGISQDFFGDLTNLGISYSRGWDEVRRNGDDNFSEDTDRQGYRVDLSQIITKNLIVNLNYEGVTDEGFLNNPYRQVRYLDPNAALGYSYQPELYPRTKTSNATAIRGKYFLPYRAALKAEFRYYSDTWDVQAWNVEVGYIHPLPKGVTLDLQVSLLQPVGGRVLQRPVSPGKRSELHGPGQRAGRVHYAYPRCRCFAMSFRRAGCRSSRRVKPTCSWTGSSSTTTTSGMFGSPTWRPGRSRCTTSALT